MASGVLLVRFENQNKGSTNPKQDIMWNMSASNAVFPPPNEQNGSNSAIWESKKSTWILHDPSKNGGHDWWFGIGGLEVSGTPEKECLSN